MKNIINSMPSLVAFFVLVLAAPAGARQPTLPLSPPPTATTLIAAGEDPLLAPATLGNAAAAYVNDCLGVRGTTATTLVRAITQPSASVLRDVYRSLRQGLDVADPRDRRAIIDCHLLALAVSYVASGSHANDALDAAFEPLLFALVDAYLASPASGMADEAFAARLASMRVDTRAFKRPAELLARLRISTQLAYIRNQQIRGIRDHGLSRFALDALDRRLVFTPLQVLANAEQGEARRSIANAAVGEALDRDHELAADPRSALLADMADLVAWASEPQRFAAMHLLLQREYVATVDALAAALTSDPAAAPLAWDDAEQALDAWRTRRARVVSSVQAADRFVPVLVAVNDALIATAASIVAEHASPGAEAPRRLRSEALRGFQTLFTNANWPQLRATIERGELSFPDVEPKPIADLLNAPPTVRAKLFELHDLATSHPGPRWAIHFRHPLPVPASPPSANQLPLVLARVMADSDSFVPEYLEELTADVVLGARAGTDSATYEAAIDVVATLVGDRADSGSAEARSLAIALIDGPEAVAGDPAFQGFVLAVCADTEPHLSGPALAPLYDGAARTSRSGSPLAPPRFCREFVLPRALLAGGPSDLRVHFGPRHHSVPLPAQVSVGLRCELAESTGQFRCL